MATNFTQKMAQLALGVFRCKYKTPSITWSGQNHQPKTFQHESNQAYLATNLQEIHGSEEHPMGMQSAKSRLCESAR